MVEAGRVEEKLGALIGRIGSYFSRVEPVRQVGKYIRGLMSDLPRKNCWTLAEYAGDATPDRMQRLLERASWNTLAVMRGVRDFVAEHLADPHGLAVVVLDESGRRSRARPPPGSSGSTSAVPARWPTRSTSSTPPTARHEATP
jgi:SRSO17 transposase